MYRRRPAGPCATGAAAHQGLILHGASLRRHLRRGASSLLAPRQYCPIQSFRSPSDLRGINATRTRRISRLVPRRPPSPSKLRARSMHQSLPAGPWAVSSHPIRHFFPTNRDLAPPSDRTLGRFTTRNIRPMASLRQQMRRQRGSDLGSFSIRRALA